MTASTERGTIHRVITGNRYLSLATSDDGRPWVAPLEYMHDERFRLYFLSTTGSRHARDIEANPEVAVAIFDHEQPGDYAPDLTVDLAGVQIEARARRLAPEDHPEAVAAAIEALRPPIPPYAAFEIEPIRFFLPRVVDGVNERVEIEMGVG